MKRRREGLRLTLQEVAAHVGIQYQTVQAYESGKAWPGPEKFSKLIEVLQTSFSFLFGETEDPSRGPQQQRLYDPDLIAIVDAVYRLENRLLQHELNEFERGVPDQVILGPNLTAAAKESVGLAHHPTPEKHAAKRDDPETVAKDQARVKKRAERDAKKPKPEAPEDPFKFR